MKACSQCGETKAYSEYYVRRASRDGLQPTCKACVKAYQAENADQIKARVAANPHIDWEASYRTRCRKFGLNPVVESFTRDEMIAYWGNGERCIYCDAPAVEIEHLIPVGLGGHHVITNVAPSCGPCNRVNTNTVRIIRATRATAILTNA